MDAAERIKYPRSVHCSSSPGYTADDVRAGDDEWASFRNREVVATIKLDGEATSVTRDAIWARSVDGYNFGPAAGTRDWMRAFWSRVRGELPEGWRFCGEGMYARHSIFYPALPSYFLLYNVWNESNECLSWEETEQWAELLGLYTVPVVYQGEFDQKLIDSLMPIAPVYGEDEVEGFVVRLADSFAYDEFSQSLRKWVRRGHVQTSTHWSHQQIVPNGLANGATPWPGKLAR